MENTAQNDHPVGTVAVPGFDLTGIVGNDGRYVMSQVRILSQDGNYTMMATNGRKAVLITGQGEGQGKVDIKVEPKILKNKQENLTFCQNSKVTMEKTDRKTGIKTCAELPNDEGGFPDVERVFPAEQDLFAVLKVKHDELLSLIKSLGQFCSDNNKLLEIKLYKKESEKNLSLPIVITPVEANHNTDRVRGILAIHP